MSFIGRPTRYQPEFPQLAHNYCLLGATNERLGDFLGVTSRTIDNWLANIPEFKDAVQRGRNQADAEVADNLYRLAVGYEHEVERPVVCGGKVHIARSKKCYPPEPKACETWLRNRRPQNWGGRVRRPRKDKEEQPVLKVPQAANANEPMTLTVEPGHERTVVEPCVAATRVPAGDPPRVDEAERADCSEGGASAPLQTAPPVGGSGGRVAFVVNGAEHVGRPRLSCHGPPGTLGGPLLDLHRRPPETCQGHPFARSS